MSLRKVFEFSEEEPTIKETASRGELLDYYSRIMEYVEDCQKQKQHELDDEGKERLEKMRIAIDKYFSEEYPQCEELDVPPEGKADDETVSKRNNSFITLVIFKTFNESLQTIVKRKVF